jgi:hypothetical protein
MLTAAAGRSERPSTPRPPAPLLLIGRREFECRELSKGRATGWHPSVAVRASRKHSWCLQQALAACAVTRRHAPDRGRA